MESLILKENSDVFSHPELATNEVISSALNLCGICLHANFAFLAMKDGLSYRLLQSQGKHCDNANFEVWLLKVDTNDSCIEIPIHDRHGQKVGILGLFHKEARKLLPSELDIFFSIGKIIVSEIDQCLVKFHQEFVNIQYKHLIEGIQDCAIYMLSPDGVIQTWNAGIERIKGYRSEEIIDRHFSIFYLRDDIIKGIPKLALETAVKRGTFSGTGQRVRKDGTIFWASVIITAVRDDSGKLLGFSKITRDLTEINLNRDVMERFFSVSLDMLAISNTNGFFTRVSPAVTEILGYTEAEFCAKHCISFIHPEDIDNTINEIQKLSIGNPTLAFENRYLAKNGTYRWLSWRAVPLGDRMYGCARDITELKLQQKQMENVNALLAENIQIQTLELKASHRVVHELIKRTEIITANVNALIWAVNKEGVFTFYDGMANKALGIDPCNRIGKSIYQIEDLRETLPILVPNVDRALQGSPSSFEIFRQGRWYNTQLNPITEPDGHISGAVGVSMDITEHKIVQLELEQKEANLRKFYDSELFGTIFWNRSGAIVGANDKFLHIIGYQREDLQSGKINWERMTPPEYAHLDEHALDEMSSSGQCHPFEKEYVRKDGTKVWVMLGAVTLKSAPADGMAFAVDITDRKRAEQAREHSAINEKAAVESSKLKSEFLASMSHEIRTPMNGVLGVASLLQDSPLSTEQRRYVDIIKNSGESLLAIINDILDFSKIESGKMAIENVEFNIRQGLNEVEDLLKMSSQKKGIRLLFNIANDIPENIVGDPGRLKQVLINLAGNAIKFTLVGKVDIRIYRTKSILRFEVQDTGIGIPIDAQKKLFNSFTQANKDISSKFGGTGLGLAISRKLIELMQGEIGLISSEGNGSTFWFSIPLLLTSAQQQGEKALPRNKLTSLPNFENQVRVLVAEDNRINQLVITKMLEKLGCKSDVVANGLEAIQAMSDFPYHCILMDCLMPEMDGYEATAAIRRQESEGKTDRTPIIALTANAMKEDEARCYEAGMDNFLSKPMLLSALAEKLSLYLSLSDIKGLRNLGPT